MKTLRLFVVAVFGLCLTSLAAMAGDPNGVWTFKAEGPQGKSLESTLTLKWENNQLSGSIDNRAGKANLRDARFADDQVSFTVVREIGRLFRKKTFTVAYRGKLEGDMIQGTISTTGRDDRPVSLAWNAQRVK